jgi:aryl-alcohol dehydrogenase-like predicted oxidoreductase
VVAKRPLGRSGIEIMPFAFGGNVFGWTADRRASFALLDHCVANGIDFVDTADVYSNWAPGNKGGESETMIGEWLAARGQRERLIIATKCGQPMGPGESGLSRAYIFRAVDRSLTRLQTDYIDLYQSHRDDPSTPLEETLGAFADLIQLGKVRAIGASNYSAARFAAALEASARLGLPRFETLQPHYNLLVREEFESGLAGICAAEKIGVIPYFALASGYLTGKYRNAEDFKKSARGARMGSLSTPRNFAILAALDSVAADLSAKPAQVALAWLLARGVTAPIASATSTAQLDELLGALRLDLTEEQRLRLEAAGS